MANDLKKLLIPYKTPYTKKRYGENHDGGYALLEEPFLESGFVYSYGIGPQEAAICFDKACSELGKSIYMYDASISSPAKNYEGFNFFKENLTPENFKEHILLNGHAEETRMTLKMDIEGDEYLCIGENIDLVAKHFNQLSIECHDLYKYGYSEQHQSFFSKILSKYKIVHMHGNNYDNSIDGLPNCLEITLLRNDYKFLNIVDRPFPEEEIDSPNNPSRSDYILQWWL